MDDGEATHHSERPEKTLMLSVRTRGQWHPKQPITIQYRTVGLQTQRRPRGARNAWSASSAMTTSYHIIGMTLVVQGERRGQVCAVHNG